MKTRGEKPSNRSRSRRAEKYAENFLSAEISEDEALGFLRKDIDTEIYREINVSASRQVEGTLSEVEANTYQHT